MDNQTIKELTSFIKNSPTAFHAVKSIRDILTKEGFQELKESEKWKIEKGGKYYVTRNHSSILAFKVGNQLDEYSFHVTASHSDSPTFKIKENAEIEVKKKYTVLNTEGYGGMICSTWFDRPLSVAGRVIVKTDSGMETRLVKVERDLLMIPSLAIHMDRAVNEGRAINKQVDMLPVFAGSAKEPGEMKKLIAEELGVEEEKIYGMDLFLYNRMEPSVWGREKEFLSCPQLDDLPIHTRCLVLFLIDTGKSCKIDDRVPTNSRPDIRKNIDRSEIIGPLGERTTAAGSSTAHF